MNTSYAVPDAVFLPACLLCCCACRFSNKKNFFKYRVSPFVSGAVYCSYLVFIVQLLHTEVRTCHHCAHTSSMAGHRLTVSFSGHHYAG
jgi:hypothetical protein